MKYLFRKEEREAVEDKFCDELVFEAMRVPCQAMMNEAKTFAMHPSELFYHVLFTIDDIRSRTLVAAQRYCDKALWDDILSDIRDKAEYCDQEEVSRVVGMILYGTAMVLIWSGKPAYTSISGVLMKQVEELKELATATGSLAPGDRVQSSPAGDKMSSTVIKWIDMEHEVTRMIDELVDLKNQIIGEIHQLDDQRYIRILEMRYIDQETFDNVQRIRGNVRRYPDGWGEAHPLTGLMYCADCGSKMYVHRVNNGKRIPHFTCCGYSKTPVGTKCLSSHRVRAEDVMELIGDMIRAIIEYAKLNREEFVGSIKGAQGIKADTEIKQKKKRLHLHFSYRLLLHNPCLHQRCIQNQYSEWY